MPSVSLSFLQQALKQVYRGLPRACRAQDGTTLPRLHSHQAKIQSRSAEAIRRTIAIPAQRYCKFWLPHALRATYEPRSAPALRIHLHEPTDAKSTCILDAMSCGWCRGIDTHPKGNTTTGQATVHTSSSREPSSLVPRALSQDLPSSAELKSS